MTEAIQNKKRILIFSARRGYSGVLVCERCGSTSACPNCGTPMRVHQAVDLILACHRCGTTGPYPKFCSNCHSSHIRGMGPPGSQKLFQEVRRIMDVGQLDRVPAVVLDTDITQNQTEEDEAMATIKSTHSSILIATQKVFSYVYDHTFDLIVVPSFDALISSPDFQTTERLWYQFEKLADFNPENIVIQTYESQPALDRIRAHEYGLLYDEETNIRKMLDYPPFSRIVKLSFSHHQASRAAREGRTLVEKLKMAIAHLGYQKMVELADASPLYVKKDQAKYAYTIILKVDPKIPNLRSLLRYAPSFWMIDVEPREIV